MNPEQKICMSNVFHECEQHVWSVEEMVQIKYYE